MAFWGGEGLLESGIVASFARPGTNVTGVYMLRARERRNEERVDVVVGHRCKDSELNRRVAIYVELSLTIPPSLLRRADQVLE